MSTKTYDPSQVSVIIGGHIVQGIAEGTFITVTRNNDTFTRAAGSDGEQVRVKNKDKSGTMVLTLMQTSESNDVLNGFAASDELGNNGTFPALVKDGNGVTVCTAEIAWVRKPADVAFAKEQSNREWTIETGELIMSVGGISPIVQS